MNTVYPVLTGAIATKGLKKVAIANTLGITAKTFLNKLSGKSCLSLPQAQQIRNTYFPEMPLEKLFERADSPNPQNTQ
jgi:hypothetical protein